MRSSCSARRFACFVQHTAPSVNSDRRRHVRSARPQCYARLTSWSVTDRAGNRRLARSVTALVPVACASAGNRGVAAAATGAPVAVDAPASASSTMSELDASRTLEFTRAPKDSADPEALFRARHVVALEDAPEANAILAALTELVFEHVAHEWDGQLLWPPWKWLVVATARVFASGTPSLRLDMTRNPLSLLGLSGFSQVEAAGGSSARTSRSRPAQARTARTTRASTRSERAR